ncbi:MAG: tetratricopeptide repeat protein [Gemmatimonadales bacterium]
MKIIAVGAAVVLGLGIGTTPLRGQEKFHGPNCELSTGNFLVKQAMTYLKGATEDKSENRRKELLVDTERSIHEALANDMGDDPAIWYFYGRYYFMKDDMRGADSAFGKVEKMVPDCADDIDYYRETAWVTHVNSGIDSLQSGAMEGAKDEFRAANAIYKTANVSYFYLGSIFGDELETDSALYYFRKVIDIGEADEEHLDNYQKAVSNMAVLFAGLEQWDSAAVWYRKVRDLDPSNTDALLGMAQAYDEMGDSVAALATYDSVLANKEALSAIDLFGTGNKLFAADKFELAVQAFEAGLEKNPFHRDALYNLANTYLAILTAGGRSGEDKNAMAAAMDKVARRVISLDPQNRAALRLLAAAHQMRGMEDSTKAVLARVDKLRYEVNVDISQQIRGGYTLRGRVVNLRARSTSVPAITFEFLDKDGNVVSTQTVAAATLASKKSKRFSFTQAGAGIVAWRYKVG